MRESTEQRFESYSQHRSLTSVDRFGVWLSGRQIRRWVPSFEGKRVGDFGCGYEATFARTILDEAARVVLADVALAPDLSNEHPKIQAFVGPLEEALLGVVDGSLDVILCISVLEHLWKPLETLGRLYCLLASGGTLLVNVPSWRGKRFLEFSAFKLGLSPFVEMDDHKAYYDVRDLWPLLVRAGFAPSAIQCFPHKFGLNTFAVCEKT